MSPRTARILKLVLYPLFYLTCLLAFAYLSFPYDALKERIVAEFDRKQAKSVRRPGEQPMRLEIDELDSYWLSGVEIEGARLIIPPKPKKKKPARRGPAAALGAFGSSDDDEAPEEPEEPSVLTIEHATARVQLLDLLVGDVIVEFEAEALGGTIEGTVPYQSDGDVEVELAGLQIGLVEPLRAMTQGIPIYGELNGSLSLTPKEGKFSQASGRLDMTVTNMVIGEKGLIKVPGEAIGLGTKGVELPAVQLGTLAIAANATDGLLTFESFGARGRDFELTGDGKIKLAESWERSQADMHIQFKFTDLYRESSDAAASILGRPGDPLKPLIEQDRDIRRSKTEEGFYRWHLLGLLNNVDFKPAGDNSSLKPTAKPRPTLRTPSPRSRPATVKRGGDDKTKPTPRARPALRPPTALNRNTIRDTGGDEGDPDVDEPGADEPEGEEPDADEGDPEPADDGSEPEDEQLKDENDG